MRLVESRRGLAPHAIDGVVSKSATFCYDCVIALLRYCVCSGFSEQVGLGSLWDR